MHTYIYTKVCVCVGKRCVGLYVCACVRERKPSCDTDGFDYGSCFNLQGCLPCEKENFFFFFKLKEGGGGGWRERER